MQNRRRVTSGAFVAGLVILLGIGACVDEQVVYEDRPPFPEPPTAAANFVGYNSPENRQTICGSCHVTQQTLWFGTKHANAFVTLDTSKSKQEFCFACHTVSEKGSSASTTPAGWTATHDARYKDVQCESCHGPGLPHVNGPTDANLPLASIKADSVGNNGCGACHSGSHHPYANEWKASRHGSVPAWSSTGPNTKPDCQGCHTGQGKLKAMGIDARSEYREKNFVGGPVQITCAVCHDPHSAEIGKQLRMPIDVPDLTVNLCMSCHNRRGSPEMTPGAKNSPHSPEGPLLLGEAGWWPPGLTVPGGPGSILGTHGSEKNPRLCAGCHVTPYTATDKLTNQPITVTGHRFSSIPCVDQNGVPTSSQSCTDLTQKSFRSCTTSGCHGSEQAARSALVVAEQRLEALSKTIDAMLKKVPPSELDANDNKYTTAEGSQFNAALARKNGTAAHNPFLSEALLTGSIAQLKKDYGISEDAPIDLRNTMMDRLRASAAATPPSKPRR